MMDAPQVRPLFRAFEQLADAPGGVAKLRELILQLAVDGGLGPQCASDEHADSLAEKIRAARRRMVAAREMKELGPFDQIAEDETTLRLRNRWAAVRLGELVSKLGAGSTPLGGRQVYLSEGIPFLRSQNVWNDGLRMDDVAFIAPTTHADMAGTTVRPGDILLNITGASIGRSSLIPDDFGEANVSQHVTIVRVIEPAIRRFLHLCVIAPRFQKRIMNVQVGVSREGLSISRLKHFPVLLPPLAEQARIVAKVDELMALCDALEARQTTRSEARRRLHAATLHHVTAARSPADLAAHWSWLRTHFDPLHATPDSIPALRQTILQLAIQGRLVPQADSGEPRTGELPVGWRNVRIAEVAENRLGKMLDKQKNRGVARPYLRNTNVHWFRFELGDIKELLLEDDEIENYLLQPGDVLICEGGHGIGRTAVWRGQLEPMTFQKALHRVRPGSQLHPDFFTYCMSVFDATGELSRYYTGAGIPHLTGQSLAKLLFPLPPLAEQKRIVAKVGQLLALCDELETRLKDADARRERLLTAAIHDVLARSPELETVANFPRATLIRL